MKKSELTRMNMLRQFIRSLNAIGYNATSIRSIAEECNTYVAHVYYYFPKKEDFITEIYLEAVRISNIVLEPLRGQCDNLSFVFIRHLLWFYMCSIDDEFRRTTIEIAKVHHTFENRINPYYNRACKMLLEKYLPFDPRAVYIASVSSIYTICAVLERTEKIFEAFDYIRIFKVMTNSFFAQMDFPDNEKYVDDIIDLFERQNKKALYEMNKLLLMDTILDIE